MIQLRQGTYFGSQTVARQIGGVRFTVNEYRPLERIPRHRHAEAFICIVARGGFTEMSGNNAPVECREGSVIWHPEGESHEDRFSRFGGRCHGLAFEDEFVRRFRDAGAVPDRWTVARSETVSWLGARIGGEISQPDGLQAFALDALVCALVAEIARTPLRVVGRPRWLDRAVERLRAEFLDPPSVSALAAGAGVHRSHFSRVFHSFERCTVGEFVRRRRVDWAGALLRTRPDLSICDVALAAGFADQSHFTRVFRRVAACTPKQFRDAR